jgi:hypothetical protein
LREVFLPAEELRQEYLEIYSPMGWEAALNQRLIGLEL